MVDFEYGKPAVTRYEIISIIQNEVKDLNTSTNGIQILRDAQNDTNQSRTRIAYYPETGRTHQLRVHSAHPDGMDAPIVGDPLYGQPSDRLYLHAETLEFRHPISGKIMKIKKEAPF